MTSIASSLALALPAPKHSGGDEVAPTSKLQRGLRIVGPGQLDETQIVLRRTGPPPYGQRTNWRPKAPEDFGDGGAFPEVPVAQYPMDMGRKSTASSNALPLTLTVEDNHYLNPSLAPPSREEIEATTARTRKALMALVGGAVASQNPKNVNVNRKEATFVRYTPSDQMGDTTEKTERILKIVERQRDPMEPPKFKQKKIPGGPCSPPPPVMHSPPRKLTAADQEMWRIPPPVSNWKNPKGYTVPLDKRVAANGQGLQDITISDKHAQFAEAVQMAEKHARQEVHQRAEMQRKLAEKEKAQKETHLQMLAQQARQDRAAAGRRRRRDSGASQRSHSRSRSRSRSVGERESTGSDNDSSEVRAREQARRERFREEERKLRQSRMGSERRTQVMAREMNRDISERIALGLAKPTQSREAMYDARLFNQDSGFESGFNEDNHYSKPLFTAQDAISSIYRPTHDDDDNEDGDAEMVKIKTGRFADVLGKGAFKGTEDAEARSGPVQFEKEAAAIFDVDQFLSKVGESSGAPATKRGYGLQDNEAGASRPKRPRVEDEDL